MKKLILILGVIIITSCSNDTVLNYKGGIIVEKAHPSKMKVRYYSSAAKRYVVMNIFVPKYEYNQYVIGDTIK